MKKRLLSFACLTIFFSSMSMEYYAWDSVKFNIQHATPFTMPDASLQDKQTIEPILQACNINPQKVVIKQFPLHPLGIAACVKKSYLTNKQYFIIDPKTMDSEYSHKELTLFHESGHIVHKHNDKCFASILVSYITIFRSSSFLLSKYKKNNKWIGTLLPCTCAALSYFAIKPVIKFHEMEADLFAVDKMCDLKKFQLIENYIDVVKNSDSPDKPNGNHPTDRQTYTYLSQFYDQKVNGKNPSTKKYCWRYFLETQAPKPLAQIVQRVCIKQLS